MSHPEQEAHDLAASGARFIFGVPGSGPSYDLLDACERAGVSFVLTAHEGAAAMMAGASAFVSHSVGAALAIKGPGVANLAGGLALSRFEQHPVVTFAEAYAPDAPSSLQHKRMPQDGLLRAVTKGCFYRSRSRPGAAALCALAISETPGPVHLNLVEGPSADTEPSPPPAAAPTDLERALDRIARASSPVIVAGAAVARLVSAGKVDLSGVGVPVLTTAAAKGAIDEALPVAAGVYTGAGAELAPEREILAGADLVVGLGLRNLEVLGAKPFPAPAILVDADVRFVDGFEPGLVSQCDSLAPAVESVLDALQGKTWGQDVVEATRAKLLEAFASPALLPMQIYACLGAAARRLGARLATDSGNFTVVAEHVWQASHPADYVGSSVGRFMGAALPQAIGAALGGAPRPVICTVGDGGLPACLAEARIAVERQLPILLVLASDGQFGSMRARVEERGLTLAGIQVQDPDWQRVLEGLSWPAERADTVAQFERAVDAWDARGPLFIEARMPPEPYVTGVLSLRR